MRNHLFEWSDEKARTNIRDHGVSFELATRVFDDLHAIDDIEDSMAYGEERWSVTGLVDLDVLIVIYTLREDRTRIISARRADRHEREGYYSSRGQT
jgi:uncharacterized protein